MQSDLMQNESKYKYHQHLFERSKIYQHDLVLFYLTHALKCDAPSIARQVSNVKHDFNDIDSFEDNKFHNLNEIIWKLNEAINYGLFKNPRLDCFVSDNADIYRANNSKKVYKNKK